MFDVQPFSVVLHKLTPNKPKSSIDGIPVCRGWRLAQRYRERIQGVSERLAQ